MDPISLIIAQVNATATEAVNQTTTRHKSTPEGMMTAYFSLVVMALLPIVIGAYRSVEHHMNQRQRREELGEQPETMSSRDAMMFPLIASGALFGLYLLFRVSVLWLVILDSFLISLQYFCPDFFQGVHQSPHDRLFRHPRCNCNVQLVFPHFTPMEALVHQKH